MKYKKNWPETKERLTALWEGKGLDRPCITVTAPQPSARKAPQPATPEQKWLDPEFVIPDMLARIESTYWGGEAIPSYLLMAGWVLCFDATPRFEMSTIWHEPAAIDWEDPPTFELNFDAPLIQRYIALYQTAVSAAGWDDFMIGRACVLPANDLVAAVLGGEEFLMATVDRPDWLKAAILEAASEVVKGKKFFAQIAQETHFFWYGNPGWMPFWAPEEYTATQSDVSCMLSPDMFDEFVVPELELYSREFGGIWYHLDGSRAFQHLPTLLSLPYIRVVQFVPEPDVPPNGPDWLDLYRQIQAAGKIVHVSLAAEHVEPLVKNLDPNRLVLQTGCGSPEDADRLLESAKRWT